MNPYVKSLFVSTSVLLVLFPYISVFGQTRNESRTSPKCEMKLTDAPNIRGMYLGMPFTTFIQLVPVERVYKDNESEISVALSQSAEQSNFGDANIDVARFIDEKLAFVTLS